MTEARRYLLPTAVLAIVVMGFSQASGPAPFVGIVVALLICGSGALLRFAYRRELQRSPARQFHRRASVFFLIGTVAVAAAYIVGLAVFRPPPGPANLLWMLGIPLALGLILAPRVSGVALCLPLAVGGLFWAMVASLMFRLPVFAM